MNPPLIHPTARIHPTALIEEGVTIGARSAVWDSVHIRHGATIGHDTTIGEKSYVAYDVKIGHFVKINAMVYICAAVTIEDGVMLSASVTFTNDRSPRALDRALGALETSAPTEETLATRVARGATVGAGAVIGPGVELGPFSMIGMGAVVTRSVPAHGLAYGNPAALVGFVCACGPRLVSTDELARSAASALWPCERCGRRYKRDGSGIALAHDPHPPGVVAP